MAGRGQGQHTQRANRGAFMLAMLCLQHSKIKIVERKIWKDLSTRDLHSGASNLGETFPTLCGPGVSLSVHAGDKPGWRMEAKDSLHWH